MAYRGGGRGGKSPWAALQKNVKIYINNGEIYVKKGDFFGNTDERAENLKIRGGTGQEGAAQFGKRKIFLFWVND